MALTSEEVVEHGAQVIEQVNKLAEQMNVFQNRLDGLGDTFDDMSQQMDDKESEVRESFEQLGNFINGEAKSSIELVGETLDASIKAPMLAGMEQFQSSLSDHYDKIEQSSEQVVETWQQWKNDEVTELVSSLSDTSTTRNEGLNDIIEATSDQTEMIQSTIDTYIDKSSSMLTELQEYSEEGIEAMVSDKKMYGDMMLESYSSNLQDTLSQAHELLQTTQTDATENMLKEVSDQFSDLVSAQMIPLIDELVQTVSDSVDTMMEDIINIGDEAGDKSQALEQVTNVLESLIEPIKDIIDRTQSIKDTVGAFI